MILDFLIIILIITIVLTMNKKNMIIKDKNKLNINEILVEERQQLCGIARVVQDNKVEFIHTGCSVDRKASFDESMPGTSIFGDDGFVWDQENALIGNGYTNGYL